MEENAPFDMDGELNAWARNAIKQLQGENTFVQDVQDFANAIDWSEPFIIIILIYHTFFLAFALIFSHSWNYQTFVFLSSSKFFCFVFSVKTGLSFSAFFFFALA